MASGPQRVHVDFLAVGIDIGLTATGVAYSSYDYSSGTEWNPRNTKVIQNWFGSSDVHHKVPTQIAYRTEGETVFKPWGFLCDPNESEISLNYGKFDVKKYWKLDMDKAETHKYFKDFLRALHAWIEDILSREFDIDNTTIEYIFSVPTTWKSSGNDVEAFKQCVREAGFEKRSNKRFFTMGLTEAEATAVYTMNLTDEKDYNINDILIVCDAGGGTTDITVLKVISFENGVYKTIQLGVVEGAVIGSVQIDIAFTEMLSSRLEKIPEKERAPTTDLQKVQKLLRVVKEGLGTPDIDLLPTHREFLKEYKGKNYPEASIINGMMRFELDEIRKIFDEKISQIIKLIENQMQNLKQKFPETRVDYLVLSGGLGSSKHLKQRLEEHFTRNNSVQYDIGRDMAIVQARAPSQFVAVCKGLVIDRLLRISGGIDVISRMSRASYGILCDEKYTRRHREQGQKWTRNNVDGKKYAKDQIQWILEKGSSINDSGPLTRKLKRPIGDHNTSWQDRVVMYEGPSDIRPRSLSEGELIPGDFQIVREIRSKLDLRLSDTDVGGPAEKRYKHSWIRFKGYWNISYEVRIIVGAADVDFELWFNDRKIGSTGDARNGIAVNWEPGILVGGGHNNSV